MPTEGGSRDPNVAALAPCALFAQLKPIAEVSAYSFMGCDTQAKLEASVASATALKAALTNLQRACRIAEKDLSTARSAAKRLVEKKRKADKQATADNERDNRQAKKKQCAEAKLFGPAFLSPDLPAVSGKIQKLPASAGSDGRGKSVEAEGVLSRRGGWGVFGD